MSALKPATNQQVRNKFLNMIGIESKLPPPSVPIADSSNTSHLLGAVDKDWSHPRNQNIACFQEALKYDPLGEKMISPKRKTTLEMNNPSTPTPKKQKKRLNFNETVEVIPIPMRNEYSNRVRSRLWSNAIEIHENAARNTVEFAAEG